jgi:hypothetical protein
MKVNYKSVARSQWAPDNVIALHGSTIGIKISDKYNKALNNLVAYEVRP